MGHPKNWHPGVYPHINIMPFLAILPNKTRALAFKKSIKGKKITLNTIAKTKEKETEN